MIKSQACIIIGSTKELKIELNNLINDKEKEKNEKQCIFVCTKTICYIQKF